MPSQNNGIKLFDFQYVSDCRSDMLALQQMILPLMKEGDSGIQTLIVCHHYQPYGGVKRGLLDLNACISRVLLEQEGKNNIDELIPALLILKDKLDDLEFDREEYPKISKTADNLKERLRGIPTHGDSAVDMLESAQDMLDERNMQNDLDELEARFLKKPIR